MYSKRILSNKDRKVQKEEEIVRQQPPVVRSLESGAIGRTKRGEGAMNERETRTLDELWQELEKARQAEREEAERLEAEAERGRDNKEKEGER